MLHKKTFLCAGFTVALWAGTTVVAQADVVTSIKPLGFIASAIADGVTKTEVLLPDGASAHDYALKPGDIIKLKNSDLVVWVGPDMEAFMQKPVAQQAGDKNIALSTLAAVKPLLMKGGDDDDHDHEHVQSDAAHHDKQDENSDDDHHHGEYNMHIWLSPEISKLAAVAIHDKLVELMPKNKAKLDANLQQFEAELARTDKQIADELSPVKTKGYFVFHDAYGYFEKQYGLTSLGHFTVNPEIQPGAQRLHNIRTELVEQKAVCVFAEPQFRPAVVEAVARGTGVRIGTLDPLGSGIALGKDSYMQFLTHLSHQYTSCLEGD
ncbi:zinc ABC transporter substrate-binding protein [Mangrovibacter phragmitis]|uniref:High-affinity zinc uptake system protein ZnuA n=1 Tax=Mangrovibacter phragmitis TaxID=1691903 RepID=A0A1B7L8K5_9ENTR|nr:zinc ABC transporter substrate-binding protein ZnuA [Mangrovibacter phragmitis]OAT78561.1 zinc ABC transporter substrate-binding protein [Mangrovibacter phragmitis]